jgi:hypothetical protein
MSEHDQENERWGEHGDEETDNESPPEGRTGSPDDPDTEFEQHDAATRGR